jgi:transcriptional regulator with XRE-family HTH domain
MDRQSSEPDNPGMGKTAKKKVPTAQKDHERLFIGEWIEALGAKQKDVADASGIGESYLSLLIDGTKKNPSALILYKISEHLGVSVNDLYNAPPPKAELEMLGQVPPRLWRAFLEVQAMMTRKT